MNFMTQQQQQLQAAQQQQLQQAKAQAKQNGSAQSSASAGAGSVVTNSSPWTSHAPLGPTSSDPFDAAWATKSPNSAKSAQSSNPFQSAGDAITQTFKVQM